MFVYLQSEINKLLVWRKLCYPAFYLGDLPA